MMRLVARGTFTAMLGNALVYTASGVVAMWGVAHLIPTRTVVAGFGAISVDNARVLTMEWIAEALTMLFVAALVVAVTLSDTDASAAALVYRLSAALLAAVGILTAVTGARTPVVWFKACPVVLSAVVGLLLAGSLV